MLKIDWFEVEGLLVKIETIFSSEKVKDNLVFLQERIASIKRSKEQNQKNGSMIPCQAARALAGAMRIEISAMLFQKENGTEKAIWISLEALVSLLYKQRALVKFRKLCRLQ